MAQLPFARGEAAKLPTAEVAFVPGEPEGLRVVSTGETAFLQAVHRTGGTVTEGSDPAWSLEADAPFGEGALDFTLNRRPLAGDLALVLQAEWSSDADVAIQLFDSANKPLALDLFGNVAQNAQAAATDTFVLPLTRYPSAARVSVRRLSGAFVIHAAGLFPVLSELPSSPTAQQAIAQQLGLTYHLPAATKAAGKQKAASATAVPVTVEATLGVVHTATPLDQINQIGAATLAQAGYPAFHRVTSGTLASADIAVSGTTSEFVHDAIRSLALQSQSALKQADFTSSNGVSARLLSGKANMGLMSVPLTSAEKEKFFKKNGYPILEFKVARDAIEVLVNAENPLKEITVPQLDAIYSAAPQAGAQETIRDWSELGGPAGEITVYGGSPGWGTTKTFRQLVLQGGEFRPDITVKDVVFRDGIEGKVATDRAAIGYVSLRPRQSDVRALAIAANSGEQAWPVEAEAIYSGHYPLQRLFYGYVAEKTLADAAPLERELVNLLLSDAGQAMVAHNGSLPLSAQDCLDSRAGIGLAR